MNEHKILLVEDDKEISEMLKNYLSVFVNKKVLQKGSKKVSTFNTQ